MTYTASSSGISLDLISGDGTGGDAEGDVVTDVEKITATNHSDAIFGGLADETFVGGNGADSLFGGGGTDRLVGGSDGDLIFGGSEIDWLYGGGGADTLAGGSGSDRLFGGSGADDFVFDINDVTVGVSQVDRVFSFEWGVDQITLQGFGIGLHDLSFGVQGSHTLVTITTDIGFYMMNQIIDETDVNGDFIFV